MRSRPENGLEVHSGLQEAVGVPDDRPGEEGSTRLVDFRVDEPERSPVTPGRQGGEMEGDRVARPDPGEIGRVKGDFDPHSCGVRERHQGFLRRDGPSDARGNRRHDPRVGGPDRNDRSGRSRLFQSFDLRLRHTEKAKAFLCRVPDFPVVRPGRIGFQGLKGDPGFRFGAGKFGRIDPCDDVSLADRIAGRADVQIPDPSRKPCADRPRPVFVEDDGRRCPKGPGEVFPLNRGEPDPERLPDAGVHRNGFSGSTGCLRIDGNVVHPHVVLHRMIRMDGRVHGVSPVQDLPFRIFSHIPASLRDGSGRLAHPADRSGADSHPQDKG